MSSGRKELSNLISSTPIFSVYYWVSLLTTFEQYRDELDIHDIRKIVDECEKCRLKYNENATDTISKQDTRPNVYIHLAKLESNIELNEHKKESLLVAVAQ